MSPIRSPTLVSGVASFSPYLSPACPHWTGTSSHSSAATRRHLALGVGRWREARGGRLASPRRRGAAFSCLSVVRGAVLPHHRPSVRDRPFSFAPSCGSGDPVPPMDGTLCPWQQHLARLAPTM